MKNELLLKKIATIYTEFPEKFGIPRQSGLADTKGKIVFEKEYQVEEALRGIKAYSHLWLIWGFSEVYDKKWSPTVRPPRLGGNKRVGVFATRSPFRPNPIGLSSVRFEGVKYEEENGWVILVSGVDMKNETPIYDIKPYLPYVDSHPEAMGGFAEERKADYLDVIIPSEYECFMPEEKRKVLKEVLSQDPRPAYQNDTERIYGVSFDKWEIQFKVTGHIVNVVEITRRLTIRSQ